MMPLRDIKIRLARKWKESKIVPGDGDQSKLNRNVKEMMNEITLALEKCDNPFESHTFNVLQKYDSKCTASLLQVLKFCYALETHDYAKLNVTVLDHKTEIEQNKNDICRSDDRALIEKGPNNKTQTSMKNNISVSNIINSAEIPIFFRKHCSCIGMVLCQHY